MHPGLWLLAVAVAAVPVCGQTGSISGILTDKITDARHSFKPPFYLASPNPVFYWKIGDGAVVTEDYVRLTPDIANRVGSLWNQQPVVMNNWEIDLRFRIGNSASSHSGTDGLAFWYVKEPAGTGPLLGYKDGFHGIGVLFDSFDNDGKRDNPSVAVVRSSGESLLNSFASDFANVALGKCKAAFRNTDHPVAVKIVYDHGTLQVLLDVYATGNYQTCVMVTDLTLPPSYYFGLTATTGTLPDYHDVYQFQCKHSIHRARPPMPKQPPQPPSAGNASTDEKVDAARPDLVKPANNAPTLPRTASAANDDDIHEHEVGNENDIEAIMASQRIQDALNKPGKPNLDLAELSAVTTYLVKLVNEQANQRRKDLEPLKASIASLTEAVTRSVENSEEHELVEAIEAMREELASLKTELVRLTNAQASSQKVLENADPTSAVSSAVTLLRDDLNKIKQTLHDDDEHDRRDLKKLQSELAHLRGREPLGFGAWLILVIGTLGYAFAAIGYFMFRRSKHEKLI